MSRPPCESARAWIVFLGQFNPSIFQPSWLAAHHLVREEEAREASVEIVHKDVTDFSLGWARLLVTRERFEASAEVAHEMLLLDLVMGVFSLLEHTPIQKMGLNRTMHFRMPTKESWHALGHRLAPKKPWVDVLNEPGMLLLSMQGKRTGSPARWSRFSVSPSTVVSPGVLVDTNEHFEATGSDGHEEMMVLLKERWREAQTFAQEAAERLLREVE